MIRPTDELDRAVNQVVSLTRDQPSPAPGLRAGDGASSFDRRPQGEMIMNRYSLAAGLALVLLGLAGPARAEEIADAIGDFLPTYTGPHDPGLDVVAHEVTF